MTLKDTVRSDLTAVFYNEDDFAERADYHSVQEGLKRQILVLKEENSGGLDDKEHTQNYERFAHVRVIADRLLGVLTPAYGDYIDFTEGNQVVRWTLIKNGVVSSLDGEHVLKFATMKAIKNGKFQANRS